MPALIREAWARLSAVNTLLPACFVLFTALTSAAETGRTTLNFNPDWKFLKADPAGAAAPAFPDGTWSRVSAPHTWNDTDTFDDWSPPSHTGETNQWSGRAWYRKSFTLPEAFRQKKVFLEFEAVRHVAEIYLNGQSLGTNRTGFIPFGFDLTPYLRFGGATNVLAVMADNRFTLETELGRIAATELPWNSPHWHPAHGGIYRNVYLHITDPLHLTLPLYSYLQTEGPYVYSTDLSDASATLHCELPLQNGRRASEKVTASVTVLDRDGKTVLTLSDQQEVAAGARAVFKLAGQLPRPQLWEPGYPYLYKAVCVLAVGGHTVDSTDVPFGIRSARWDVKTGFYLNGRHIKLHGWGQRPTSEWPGLGAAHPDWMHYFTLQLMQEAGGNFVRWGHCAGAPADITAADQLGLITIQPGVDGEGDARGEAWTLRAATFRDMLIYFRNHPSILIWEGGNQKVTRDHARELRAYVDALDPHGGRAYAHRRADEITGEFMDVDIGTEGGRQVPRLPVVEGEYNREESPRRVWDDYSPPRFGYPEAKGQTYQLTSEQYAVNQVSQYIEKLGAANHCGGANWLFSDSTSGGRVACEVARVSGEVDGARLPKEAYYVCQTMWRPDPQVHIVGHWNYPAGTKKTIYVTSNCGEVELFRNGVSLGKGERSQRYLFTFPEVTWEPGELRAVGLREGKPAATDLRKTAGLPHSVRLTAHLGPKGWQADGSDVALVDVEVVDARGQRCPTFEESVQFSMAGPGVWRGGYNSGKTNSINRTSLDVECGINRVALRSTRTAGTVLLTARCGSLKPATITLRSRAAPEVNGAITLLPPLPAQPALLERPQPGVESDDKPEPVAVSGRFIKTFSYSGPTANVRVAKGLQNGSRVYVDKDYIFSAMPDSLQGCDWVQTASADNTYSSVDLMELATGEDGLVYIAHDDRVARPEWLTRDFKATDLRLAVHGRKMTLFERQIKKGESLTLGSNCEDRGAQNCNMYIVFVKAAPRLSRR